jgi:hypothetical protein
VAVSAGGASELFFGEVLFTGAVSVFFFGEAGSRFGTTLDVEADAGSIFDCGALSKAKSAGGCASSPLTVRITSRFFSSAIFSTTAGLLATAFPPLGVPLGIGSGGEGVSVFFCFEGDSVAGASVLLFICLEGDSVVDASGRHFRFVRIGEGTSGTVCCARALEESV